MSRQIQRQSGFTLMELIVAACALASLAASVALAWAAIHFIAKFW